MQEARLIVTEAEESYRKNLEIKYYMVHGHISLCFWSGSRENKIVLQSEPDDDQVTTTSTELKKSTDNTDDFFKPPAPVEESLKKLYIEKFGLAGFSKGQ